MDILDEFDEGGIYIRHAIDDFPSWKNHCMHVHNRCEIFYFISGNAEYIVEGSVYPLEVGSLLIMRSGEAHCVKILSSKKYERYVINFPLSVFDSFDPQRRLLTAFTERQLGKGNLFTIQGLEDTFKQMFEKNSDDYARQLIIVTKLVGLLDKISSEYNQRCVLFEGSPKTLTESIVAYVNLHLFEELSIPMLAERFFLSPSQLCRVFKQATGAPPWEYITAKRLTVAKEKIHNGFTAQETAEGCGFKDYSAFYRAYVKRFGCSPNKSGKMTATK